MILEAMLERLRNGLSSGPGLNARPSGSRQRIDALELGALGAGQAGLLLRLLTEKEVTLSADFRAGGWPSFGEMSAWEPAERAAFESWRRQEQVLRRLNTIAADAQEYFNDHGETALALGFPLVSIPRELSGRRGISSRSSRWLAPVAYFPVSLQIRLGSRAGVTLRLTGEGERLLEPNTALFALLEQLAGHPLDLESTGNDGGNPAAELAALLQLAAGALHQPLPEIGLETALAGIPLNEDLPGESLFLPSAVLGLFPMQNPGLMRDMQWMLENEASLVAPVRSFLTTKAMEVPMETTGPVNAEISIEDQVREITQPDPAAPVAESIPKVDFTRLAPLLVSEADPCQADAVKRARQAEVLVVHGPPGTGKSQTIANMIGDHAARGERVLFVCEKRTALDVVKYRLDAIGLGHLCGVVHDPRTDRQDFYLGLRQQLESLTDSPDHTDLPQELLRLDARIDRVRAELSAAFTDLHLPCHGGRSFHDLVGEWLANGRTAEPLPEGLEDAGYGMEELEDGHLTLESIAVAASRVNFMENPWRGWSLADPAVLAGKSERHFSQVMERLLAAAEAADAPREAKIALPDKWLASPTGIREVIAALATTAVDLEAAFATTDMAVRQRYLSADAATLTAYLEQARRLGQQACALLQSTLDTNLIMAIPRESRRLPEVNVNLVALESWADGRGIAKWFRFLKAGRARAVLAPLGMVLNDANAQQGLAFYRGLRDRLMLNAGLQTSANESEAWLEDSALSLHWHGRRALAEALHRTLPGHLLAAWRGMSEHALTTNEISFPKALKAAENRLLSAIKWAEEARVGGIFSATGLTQVDALACGRGPLLPTTRAWARATAHLEDMARIQESLANLPPPLSHAAQVCAGSGLTPEATRHALRQIGLGGLLRQLITQRPALAAVDSDRLGAAFDSLHEWLEQRRQLARQIAGQTWTNRQRGRLLAGTGSRLNALGAALRQRLYVRGARAMRLRPMIASGADIAGGDPLFDLCPIWMAGPATVAQILPRAAIFDIVIFDEASQCRLEEALPVMLRAKRLVIAGDPKQLSPTRFFESSIKDSVDTEAETGEELFEQRQTEAEDLLTAALNLEVEEAFLDVHYRSHHEDLIGYSNRAFYHERLLPIPGHPKNKALDVPIKLHRADGIYQDRANQVEAEKAVGILAGLLAEPRPPSVGIACFNMVQRDLILEKLSARAGKDPAFASRLAEARSRHDSDSHQGLFVKNLENVQGDERDVIIISTTFGPDPEGKFRRNFGALNRSGGGRRMNVLVTRARRAVHVITSIPRGEYAALPDIIQGAEPNGRYHLYAYLAWAERLKNEWDRNQESPEPLPPADSSQCLVADLLTPSAVATSVGQSLLQEHGIGSIVHWGNEGFCIDAALMHPSLPAEVTIGVLTDFTRYRRTRDPITWDLFRTTVLRSQGWALHRVWSPTLFRRPVAALADLAAHHEKAAG
jgi:AAA domain/REase_MTES_1575